MLLRVRDFGHAHAALFPTSSLAQAQFAAVDAVIMAVSLYAVTKMSAKRDGKAPKASARQALLDRLEAVALTGRALAKTQPDIADKFRIPHPQPDQALITAGRLFAKNAEAFKPAFLAHAMPESFIVDLTKAVDDFERAIQERGNSRAESAGVQASIRRALADGMAAIARLDAIVSNHVGHDPKLMAAWKRERRVAATRRRGAAQPAPASSPTPSEPAAPGQPMTPSAASPVPPQDA
jgi:hypothetical protein